MIAAHPVAVAANVQYGRVVEKSVDDGRSDDRFVEDLAPVPEPTVGGQDDGATLIALGDHVEDPVGRGLVHREITELINDEQGWADDVATLPMQQAAAL